MRPLLHAPLARGMQAFVLALAGCACLTERQTRAQSAESSLSWLCAGASTEADVVRELGPARQVFEQGRIQAWRLRDDLLPATRDLGRPGPWSLVVVFGDARRVERASLVRLW